MTSFHRGSDRQDHTDLRLQKETMVLAGTVPLASSMSEAIDQLRHLRQGRAREASKSPVQGACETLWNSDKPIAEIALDFGFCDQSAFTQPFRRNMGLTPAVYRKRG
ncbi:MAG: helix-turn-helix transcriptional regulator [Verrucomicrobiae bacterium]|nr:helix-turn-helix transcriptional regulator [Verrucomicrobiae bacterium]MCB1090228.1 helix-turn-helix transcriptional regulator [Verrucomicrobiae bacterium]